MANKSGIHINPANKGKFNALKKKTGKSTEELTHSKNPLTRKRAVFAQNSAKWHHGQAGVTLPKVDLSTLPGSTVPEFTPYKFQHNHQPDNHVSPPQPIDWSNTITAGLLAIDSLIPPEKSQYPVVRPSLSYNEHPYGTGSQAIAKNGIKISNDGYKYTSEDRNRKKLRIPSNRITMKDVPHPVLGIDSLGNQQLMLPGNEYQFQGEYVDEIPMAKNGYWIQGAVNPKHKGYCTPMTKSTCTPKRKAFAMTMKKHHGFHEDGGSIPIAQDGGTMQPQQIDYFNGFIDYVKQKGLQGSKKLNTGGLNEKLYSEYQKTNPSVQLPLRDLTKMAQNEQHRQKQFDTNFAQRKQLPNAQGIANASISPIDDYFGSETSKRPIPRAELQTYNNNKLTSVSDLGYVPNSINATTPKIKSNIPKGTVAKRIDGMDYYEDPTTGYLIQLGSGGSLSASKAKEMLRDGTAHGKKLTAKQKRYFGYIAGGGTPKAEDGLTILDESTIKFNGDKHSDPSGGIPISYGGKNVMVEGDETGYLSPVDDSLTIMGNMKNPLTGRKFKSDSKILAEKEAKMNTLLSDGFELIDNNKPMDKWGSLKFNAGNVMMQGAAKKKKELLSSKEHLKSLQQAMLDISQEQGVAPEKAKYGLEIAQRGITLDNGKRVTYKKWIEIQKQANVNPFAVTPTDTPPDLGGEYSKQIQEAAGKYGVDPNIIEKLVFQESNSNPNAKSDRGAKGIMQFMEGTAKKYGINPSQLNSSNPLDIQAVIDAGVHHFSDLLKDSKGDYKLALMSYNAGPGILKGTKNFQGYYKKASKELGKPIDQISGDDILKVMQNERVKNPTEDKHAYRNETYDYVNTITNSGENFKKFAQGFRNKYYSDTTPYNPGEITWKDIDTPPAQVQKKNTIPQYDPTSGFKNPTPYNLPSNAQDLELTQVLPELYAAATNKVDPVFMQKYQPELYEPYQVSYQDQLNENQGTFSALSKAAAYNPSALGTLAGQKYSADSGVLANEFRTNQGIANEITNKNIQLINDVELKNLGLADTQYTRQSQAKSNTKAINHDVLNSISNKILQKEANNNKLQLYENLYRFRFDPRNNHQAYNAGPSGNEFVDYSGLEDNTGNDPTQSTKQNYNKNGQLTSYSVNTPSMIKNQMDYYNLQNKTSIYPDVKAQLKKSISKSFNEWRHK